MQPASTAKKDRKLEQQSAGVAAVADQRPDSTAATTPIEFDVNLNSHKWWNWLTLAVPLVAVLPLFVFQAAEMWSNAARVFFPLVFLLIAVVAIAHTKHHAPTQFAIRRWIAIVLFVVAAVTYGVAVWQFSPWWAQVAALITFFAWAMARFGDLSSGVVALWTLCLATTLTLPFGWETGLPQTIRQLAAFCCSKTLDGVNIPHLWVGNLLELRDYMIVIDEVCGGWSSIFALAAITAGLIVVQKRALFVAVLSMLAVPLWMLLAYYLKLIAIAIGHEVWGRDLSSGWDFLLLDTGTFVFAVACAWLLTRTLAVLFEPVPTGDAEFGPLFASMNKLLCWPQPDPFEDIPPQDPDDLKHFLKLKRERQKMLETKPRLNWWNSTPAKWTVLLGTAAFALAAVLPSAVIATGAALPRFADAAVAASSIEQLKSSPLPTELNGWRLLIEKGEAADNSTAARQPLEWQYRSPEQIILLQIAHPFRGWSDPAESLVRRGWTVVGQSIEMLDSEHDWPIYMAELENDLGGRVYLLASFINDQFEPYTGLPDFDDSETDEASTQNILEILRGRERVADQTTLQIRLVCESGEPMTPEKLEALQEQFDQLRRIIRDPSSAASDDAASSETPAAEAITPSNNSGEDLSNDLGESLPVSASETTSEPASQDASETPREND